MTCRVIRLALSAAIALGSAAVGVPAQAQVAGQPLNPPTAKEHREAQRHKHERPHQIACTVAGCHPIPATCHPEMGYDGDGIPTGFDIVVCP
jgi:hypothetical protein